ncbi:hypothetical protein VTO42DRAFT_1888 [Malbranchea cinnamomea]
MAATTAAQMASGANGTEQADAKEIIEYQKILNIRDQIFSGNHPRLKVPQHVVRKISPRSIQTSSTPAPPPPIQRSQQAQQTRAAMGTVRGQDSRTPTSTVTGTSSSSTANAAGRSSGPTGGRVVTTKPTSEIDPIFLTKSDDLIRAEMQLQRQRIERSLRDQLEQKKYEATQKPSPHESKPDFNVAEVLAKAWELVKPIPVSDGETANGNVAASDSFDDNSFYSSRAPDSPQHVEPTQDSPVSDKQNRSMVTDNADADVRVDRRSNGARDYDPASFNPVTLDTHPSPYDPRRRSLDSVGHVGPSPRLQRMAEPPVTYDEPEYSPPEPDVPFSRVGDTVEDAPDSARARRHTDHRPLDFDQDSQRLKVVNNHISSPAAPQPSRVSPLAVSRVSSFQGRRGRQDRQADKTSVGIGSGRTSPEGPTQPPFSRKRRRLQETRERPRYADERRSPETPYIKPEPVSPPPFTDAPISSSYTRPRVVRGPVVDVEPPHYPPATDRRVYDERYADDVGVPRASSRLAYSRPTHEAHDLRRVASLQHARHPEYIQDYVAPEPVPRCTRAASYAVTDRPALPERDIYYEEPAQPSYPKRYLTRAPSPTSPRYRDDYAEVPRAMAPPPRRVVVDTDGNRYYESVPAPKLAPPPPPRFTRVEEYEDAIPGPGGHVRAVSVVDHPYGDRRYQQEMMPPPPPVAYRRAPEYSRSVAPEPRVYDREPDQRHVVLRSGSVQVVDYPPRRVPYVEEEGRLPREEMVRMPSVRPPATRYEERREPMPRLQSVRPAGREMSVYVHDEPRPQPAYIPTERVGYPVARRVREERYYDDEPARVTVGHGPETVHRVSRHY